MLHASMPRQAISVFGAGSWGTALAIHAARSAHDVRLWARRDAQAQAMAAARQNADYLPEIAFPPGLKVTSDADHALARAELVIVAVPSHAMRTVVSQVGVALRARPEQASKPAILLASKGFETESLQSMVEVATAELPASRVQGIAVLGGPSFAREVAQGMPTAVVVAAYDRALRETVQHCLSGEGLRVYITEDVLGVELGGTFKNVVALAAGICDGAGFGQNARAGLITRGLGEISRLAKALGADPQTISGLAGLGDLVLTCTGGLSRNRAVGLALGQGKKLPDILRDMNMVAEGVRNTVSAVRLAQRHNIDVPIMQTVHAMLYEDLSVEGAVQTLMGRELKDERQW